MIKLALFLKERNKGQSFVELTIVLGVLLLLLTGMVEFGNLLNQYINLVDGAREGARYGSNNDPFLILDSGGVYDYSHPQESFFENIDLVIEGDLKIKDPTKRTSALAPITLDYNKAGVRSNGEDYKPDDVLITFFAVSGKSIVKTFPETGPWHAHKTSQVSRITASEIKDQLEDEAPSTGILLVEIFYNYHQLLDFPFFTSIVPNPVPVHVYSFMPLAGAEATPTP